MAAPGAAGQQAPPPAPASDLGSRLGYAMKQVAQSIEGSVEHALDMCGLAFAPLTYAPNCSECGPDYAPFATHRVLGPASEEGLRQQTSPATKSKKTQKKRQLREERRRKEEEERLQVRNTILCWKRQAVVALVRCSSMRCRIFRRSRHHTNACARGVLMVLYRTSFCRERGRRTSRRSGLQRPSRSRTKKKQSTKGSFRSRRRQTGTSSCSSLSCKSGASTPSGADDECRSLEHVSTLFF